MNPVHKCFFGIVSEHVTAVVVALAMSRSAAFHNVQPALHGWGRKRNHGISLWSVGMCIRESAILLAVLFQ